MGDRERKEGRLRHMIENLVSKYRGRLRVKTFFDENYIIFGVMPYLSLGEVLSYIH